MTNDLERRMAEHKSKKIHGFASRYNLTWLAYYEVTTDVNAAIAREKQIKSWGRAKKIALVKSTNPVWKDLTLEWGGMP